MLKRTLAVLIAALLFHAANAKPLHGSGVGTAATTGVFTLRTGAGGQVSSIDIQCDQGVGACNNSGTTTKVIRTDTGGAYVYNSSASNPGNAGGTGVWQQLVTTTAIPFANWNQYQQAETVNGMGGYEIRLAPSNTNVIYLVYNGYVLVSTNKGATFCDTGLTQQTLSTNNLTKFMSPLMAVDPSNPDVVIFGTLSNGIYFTNTGRTCGGGWTQISSASIPNPLTSNGYLVAFDTTSTVTGGKTQGIYVSSAGNGVYHTTSGIAGTWTHMASSPTTQLHIVCASDGIVWFIDNSNGNYSGRLWTLTSGTWTQNAETSPQGWRGVAVDPANAARAILMDSGGGIDVTVNHGAAWAGYFGLANGSGPLNAPQLMSGSVSVASGSQSLTTSGSLGLSAGTHIIIFSRANPNKYIAGTVTSDSGTSLVVSIAATLGSGSFSDGLINWGNPYRIATDVPWLMGTNENFMTAGDVIFDPAGSNSAYFVEGIGVWQFNPPAAVGPYAYNSVNSGIEQLVGMGVVSPWNVGSTPVTFSWDRPVIKNPNDGTYPLSHGLSYTHAIELGMGGDWASGQTPAFVAVQTASSESGTSSDNGATWTLFGTVPASIETNGQASGSMAVADTTHMIWEQSFNGDPYYTINGGTTWVKVCVTGVACGTTSTTSKAIVGSGSVVFTTTGGSDCTFLNFAGKNVTVYESAAQSSGMSGTITSCLTGNQFTMNVSSSFGSGTFTAWKIRPDTGWGTNAGSNFQQFAADRVNATTFYAYNSLTGNVYVSTAGTPSFSVAATNPFTSGANGVIPRMKCVPGQAGNCFWTSGIAIGNSFPQAGFGLYRTTNSAVTWTGVGASSGDYTVQEVYDFGFGNACGGGYPTIFLYGWVGRAATFANGSASISVTNNYAAGQQVSFATTGGLPTNFAINTNYVVSATGLSSSAFQVATTPTGTPIIAGSAGSGTQTAVAGGIWRSKDNAVSWQQQTGLYPDGIIDQITAIEGDANTCGRFYFAKEGTGWGYGQFN